MTAPALDGDYRLIPIGRLIPAGDNPRKNRGPLEELACSIKEQGVLEPLLVEAFGPQFRIVAGERRWAAAKLAGLKEVPCIVRQLEGERRREVMIVENLQRRGLLPLEEAEAYQQLVDLGYTQEAIAQRIGKSKSHVSERMQLLYLPAATKKKVASGELPVYRALQRSNAPGEDLFAADDELNHAWRELRQDLIDSGDRRSIELLRKFAAAFRTYLAALKTQRGAAG